MLCAPMRFNVSIDKFSVFTRDSASRDYWRSHLREALLHRFPVIHVPGDSPPRQYSALGTADNGLPLKRLFS